MGNYSRQRLKEKSKRTKQCNEIADRLTTEPIPPTHSGKSAWKRYHNKNNRWAKKEIMKMIEEKAREILSTKPLLPPYYSDKIKNKKRYDMKLAIWQRK